MKILFIGDIFGKAGIRAVVENVSTLKKKLNIDLVIANAENASQCDGLTPNDYEILTQHNVDIITLGNHAFGQESILKIINNWNIIRPLNYSVSNKYASIGYGSRLFEINNKTVRVTNLLGTSVGNKNNQTNPFLEMNRLLETSKIKADLHIVDFHAEYTGEKNAFLTEFAGKVSAIIGTHTHVQTNDAKIYQGTAYITDVGMTGPHDGIIGANPYSVLEKAKGNIHSYVVEEADGHYQLNAVVIEFDNQTNKAIGIQTIYFIEKGKCLKN